MYSMITRCLRRLDLRIYSSRVLSSETHSHAVETETHSADIGTVKIRPTSDELEDEDQWMQEEIKDYYNGRSLLAKMMGRDPTTFTDKDIEEAINYLLPSSLTAKDARPFMKHPSMIYPKRQESSFDNSGRPLEPAFYTGSPMYHNLIHEMYKQERKLELSSHTSDHSPNHSRESDMPMRWLSKEKFSNKLAEELTDKEYDHLIERLTALASNEQSHIIKEFLDNYRTPVLRYRSKAKLPVLNDKGVSFAVGRRKTATASVWLKYGSGNIVINKKNLIQYFPRIQDRQQVLYPFMVINQLGHYDVLANIEGGGTTGQAGSLRLGISKALLGFSGDHGDILEKAGLLIRDPRMVERKKPGQKKARKKFAWVKR